MNKKHIYRLVVAVLFILLIVILYIFSNEKKKSVLPQKTSTSIVVSDCNLVKGCLLPNQEHILVKPSLQEDKPFTFELHGESLADKSPIYITFTMKDMDMGINRYDLIQSKEESGTWYANDVRVPKCSSGRNDFILNIYYKDNLTYEVPFVIFSQKQVDSEVDSNEHHQHQHNH